MMYSIFRYRKEASMDEKYVQRVIDKYNRDQVELFEQKSDKYFLSPVGLTLKYFPSKSFGNNCTRLSREEEFDLFAALHYMKYKLTKTTMQSKGRYLQIYLALRNRGISANRLLVFDCVKRHSGRFRQGIDTAKLTECGCLSLIYAVDGFDPWRGFRFSTYACNAITRSFFNRNQMENLLVSLEEAENVSTDPIDEDSQLWIERLEIALEFNDLTPREREVVEYRFKKKMTLKETGKILEVTKERVRQIQNNAIAKLKICLNEDPVLS